MLTDALEKNLNTCLVLDSPSHKLNKTDIQDCAKVLEYDGFTSNKVISLYRRTMAQKVQ